MGTPFFPIQEWDLTASRQSVGSITAWRVAGSATLPHHRLTRAFTERLARFKLQASRHQSTGVESSDPDDSEESTSLCSRAIFSYSSFFFSGRNERSINPIDGSRALT